MELQLIRGGETHPVDAERIIPGRLVVAGNDAQIEASIFRVGDRYYKRVTYHDLNYLVDHIRDCMEEWTSINRGEWAHLQELAGGGSRPAAESPPKAKREKPDASATHGHRWKAAEFRRYFAHEAEGGRLIAHQSYAYRGKDEELVWNHEGLFRMPGKRAFLYVETSSNYPQHDCKTVHQVLEVRAKYRKMDTRLEPLSLRAPRKK